MTMFDAICDGIVKDFEKDESGILDGKEISIRLPEFAFRELSNEQRSVVIGTTKITFVLDDDSEVESCS